MVEENERDQRHPREGGPCCATPAARMRSLIIGLLLAAVGIATVVLLSRQTDEAPATPASPDDAQTADTEAVAMDPEPPPPPSDWPHPRGGYDLRGYVDSQLPDTLQVAWTVETAGIGGGAAVVGDEVFVGDDDGTLYVLDRATGATRWTASIPGAFGAGPVVHGNDVICVVASGSLHVIDRTTHEERWQALADDQVTGAAGVVELADGRMVVVFTSHDFNAYGHDLASGKRLWTFTTENYIYGGPAIADGKAIFGGCDQTLYVVDAATGEEGASAFTPSYMQSSAAIDWPQAFVGTGDKDMGSFVAIDLASQEDIWYYDEGDGPYVSIPAVGPDAVVFGGQDMVVTCVERATGAERWTFLADDVVESSPVIVGDKVVVGSADGRVYLLALADGRKLWSYDTGSSVYASPTVVGEMVLIGATDGNLYAFTP